MSTRGSIVLVPFPFDDLSRTKLRPALCLTEPIGPHRHVVLAFVTSNVPAAPDATDVVVDPASSAEATATGLKFRSAIRLHRMMTVSTSIIQRRLGALPASLEDDVASRLAGLFGIERARAGSAEGGG